jgi:hypothetical protein
VLALGGQPKPRKDTYQARYSAALGAPTTLLQTLALTQVFERRVQLVYQAHLRKPGTHPRVAAVLAELLEDEKHHLVWVRRWLDTLEGDVGGTLRRYQQADREIALQLSAELLGSREAA